MQQRAHGVGELLGLLEDSLRLAGHQASHRAVQGPAPGHLGRLRYARGAEARDLVEAGQTGPQPVGVGLGAMGHDALEVVLEVFLQTGGVLPRLPSLCDAGPKGLDQLVQVGALFLFVHGPAIVPGSGPVPADEGRGATVGARAYEAPATTSSASADPR